MGSKDYDQSLNFTKFNFKKAKILIEMKNKQKVEHLQYKKK